MARCRTNNYKTLMGLVRHCCFIIIIMFFFVCVCVYNVPLTLCKNYMEFLVVLHIYKRKDDREEKLQNSPLSPCRKFLSGTPSP